MHDARASVRSATLVSTAARDQADGSLTAARRTVIGLTRV